MSLDNELSNEEKLRVLLELQKSAGWKLFQELIANTKQTAFQKIVAAQNPHEMAVNSGISNSADRFEKWLDGMLYYLNSAKKLDKK